MYETTQKNINSEKRRYPYRIGFAVIILFVLIPALIALGITVWDDRKYYIVSMGMILLSGLPLIIRFEKRRPQARELVLLAVMVALSVASRVAFYMLPQFKPVTAMIIITGIAFGAEAGFVAGTCTGFISNFFFGQGPWTPWQMFGFGIVGFMAGLIFRKESTHRVIPICIYGGLSTFIFYGFVADTGSIFMYTNNVTLGFALSVYASGVWFNLIHAAATVVFLSVLSKPVLRKLDRVKTKFGILNA